MNSTENSLAVGIVSDYRNHWVAGPIYTINLHRVLQTVKSETGVLPNTLHSGLRRFPTRLASDECGHIQYFSHIESQKEPKIKRLTKRLISQFRNPGAQALESIIERERINILYPGMGIETNIGCKQVHWIPDFQHLRFPHFFPGEFGVDRTRYIDGLLERAETIFLSSHNALDDAREFRPQYLHKLHVLPFVLVPEDKWFKDTPEAEIHPITEGREYLIFPSQLWLHKGHEILVRALAILKEDYQLDILTLCPGFQEDYRFPHHFSDINYLARELGVSENIRFLGLLDRQLLMQLMRGARAVVQPSRFEGWSALIEDAQGIGKPIIASDIPVHREQDPPDTVFFEDGDAESLAETIANQWSNLPLGFDLESEEIGRTRQHQRVHEFGHYFANLLREVDRKPAN